MIVRITLVMNHVVLEGEDKQEIKCGTIELSWVEEKSQDEILDLSREWLKNQNFIKDRTRQDRLPRLKSVGQSSLTFAPIE